MDNDYILSFAAAVFCIYVQLLTLTLSFDSICRLGKTSCSQQKSPVSIHIRKLLSNVEFVSKKCIKLDHIIASHALIVKVGNCI